MFVIKKKLKLHRMSNRWRPGIDAEFKEEINNFIDRHPELGFNKPKDVLMQATREYIYEKDSQMSEKELQEKLDRIEERLK